MLDVLIWEGIILFAKVICCPTATAGLDEPRCAVDKSQDGLKDEDKNHEGLRDLKEV